MLRDPTKFTFKSTDEIKGNAFFTSIFIFCEGKETPKSLVVVEISSLSLIGQALANKKRGQTDGDAYEAELLNLLTDTQESLTINFIDTEYERSKQGISPYSVN